MKRFAFILQLLFTSLMLVSSLEVAAAAQRVNIRHYPIGKDRPRPRTEFVICNAYKEAGYLELQFMVDLGEVRITLTNSMGSVIKEVSHNSNSGELITLTIPDPKDNYILIIEGDQCLMEGEI